MKKRKVSPKSHLFWFLKEKTQLDLTEPSVRDMYVRQVITRGRAQDVRSLLKTVNLRELKESLQRLRRFIPREIRDFWEDYIGSAK